MTSHFICAGFEDVVSEINFDEKFGLININLNMPDSREDIFISLNLMQTKSICAIFTKYIGTGRYKNGKQRKCFW